MISQAVSNKVLFKALERTKFGSIKIKFQKPFSEYEFGEGPLVAELSFLSPRILHEVVRGGDVELASAIVQGSLSISDEAAFIAWACKNDQALKDTFYGQLLSTLLPRIKRWLRRNTVNGAKRNIMEHYDLGNHFYSQWLDPSMTYSSALFRDNLQNLFEAQQAKYDRIIDDIEISSKDHVLEIGCGWGGFFSRAVERTGCKVTAVMNSPAQASYNRELIKKKHLGQNVSLEMIDYRNIQGKFDKVVSIEMIEAVGRQYWPVYFDKIATSLQPGGKALIQSITIRENRFEDYCNNPDFISTMIFPGGMLLTNNSISKNAIRSGMKGAHPFEFGLCYARTLCRWRENFLKAWKDNLLPKLDSQFVNLWRFYLSYCEGAFTAERVNVGHYRLEKPY